MNLFKILFYGLMIIVLFITIIGFVSAYDQEFSISINESQLPFSNSFSFNLSLLINETAYFNQGLESGDDFNISFVNNTFFDLNPKSILINYSVSNHSIFSDEHLNESFIITNSFNNNSYEYLVSLNIINDVIVGSTINNWSIELINSSYTINVSKSLLPVSGDLYYALNGLNDSVINLSCSGVLSCPDNISTNNVGFADFFVHYLLPINLSIGVFDEVVIFSFINNSNNNTNNTYTNFSSSVHFVIAPIIQVWEDFVIDSEDIAYFDNDTWIRASSFNALLSHFISEMKRQENLCEEDREESYTRGYGDGELECEVEYVVTGSIDDTTYSELVTCRGDRDSYRNDYNDLLLLDYSAKLLVCNSSLLGLREDYNNNLSLIKGSALAQYTRCVKEKLSLRWGLFGNVILVLFIGLVIFFLLRAWWKRKHEDNGLNGFGGEI